MSINILHVKKYCLLIKKKITEQGKFTDSPLREAFEKQAKTTEDQGKIKSVQ